jgi:hypothetical protein
VRFVAPAWNLSLRVERRCVLTLVSVFLCRGVFSVENAGGAAYVVQYVGFVGLIIHLVISAARCSVRWRCQNQFLFGCQV